MLQEWYHSLVAALNFLASITREELRFVLGKLAKYSKNPGLKHFKALKHALRFLKGTLDYGVEFIWRASDPANGPLDITAWTDSSFADDVDTARTTIGIVIKVNGATVSATSRLSPRVDSCVNHSELRAFDSVIAIDATRTHIPGVYSDAAGVATLRASRTITWVRGLKAAFERRDASVMPPTPVCVDNADVLFMLEAKTIKPANKHIYRTLAELRERVHLDKIVVAVKIHTKENLANAMTKQEADGAASAAQLRKIAGPPTVI